jgi:hypothetical protein
MQEKCPPGRGVEPLPASRANRRHGQRHVQADSARQELFKKVNCPSNSPPSEKRTLKNKSKSSSKTKRGLVSKAR